MVELFRERLSNEKMADRIARMVAQLEQAAGGARGEAGVERVRDTFTFGGADLTKRVGRRDGVRKRKRNV